MKTYRFRIQEGSSNDSRMSLVRTFLEHSGVNLSTSELSRESTDKKIRIKVK